jgi:hypothetical protein
VTVRPLAVTVFMSAPIDEGMLSSLRRLPVHGDRGALKPLSATPYSA